MNTEFNMRPLTGQVSPRSGWLIGVSILLEFLCGCSSKTLNWTEDVLLPDGRTVTLTRHQEYERRYSWEAFGNGDYWFEFKNPDTGKPVRWSHDRGLGTVALLVSNAAPYLLTITADGHGMEAYHNPNPPYLLFKFEGAAWTQLTLKEMPIQRLRSNMTDTGFTARERVNGNGHHLSTDITQASVIDTERPWVIDFSLLEEQTFGDLNRDKPLDYLLATSQTAGDAQ